MKLILTHEVTGLGAPGDIVEVKDGYGRNYLIPRGFAIRWTTRRREADRLDQGRPQRARGPRPRQGEGDQGHARGLGRRRAGPRR